MLRVGHFRLSAFIQVAWVFVSVMVFRLSCAFVSLNSFAGAAIDGFASAPLAAAVAEQFPEASGVIVGDALRAALVAEGLPLSEALCLRDYSAPCPMGWVDVGDGGTCLAPDAYTGPCSESVDFRGLPAHEKMLAASRCGAAFRCAEDCTPEFDAVCPVGWSESLGVCEAPADYTGPCVGRKGFASINAIGKALFANACAVRWPCRRPRGSAPTGVVDQQCSADFAAACPEGWALHESLCVAPSHYQGPCPVAGRFREYSSGEKVAIADACGSPWSCKA